MSTIGKVASAISISFVVACGGAAPEANAPSSAGGDQVAMGQKLYGEKCASCHGADGSGTKDAPPVVGKNALPLDPPATAKMRKTKFHTAADVFGFVKANMPSDNAGSLSDDQYAAILAFDLKANGVELGGKHVDATTASSFVLHP